MADHSTPSRTQARLLRAKVAELDKLMRRHVPGLAGGALRGSGFDCMLDICAAHDPDARPHAELVSRLSVELGRALKLTRGDLAALGFAARFHDIGKIVLEAPLLSKSARLNPMRMRRIRARHDRIARFCGENGQAEQVLSARCDLDVIEWANTTYSIGRELMGALMQARATLYPVVHGPPLSLLDAGDIQMLRTVRGNLLEPEWAEMRLHPILSSIALARVSWSGADTQIPLLALSHHEDLNGSGYPYGLRGSDLPLGARIIALTDKYAAIISSLRAYRHSFHPSPEAALAELRLEVLEQHLDARVFAAFERERIYLDV